MHRKGRIILVSTLAILGGAVLALSGCTRPQPTPSPTPPPTATPATMPTVMPAMMAEGKTIYDKSCAVCHGPSGEGTAAGPAISGHSSSAVKTQARSPLGKMPAFPLGMMSDADLDKVAGFISGLGPAKPPVMEWEKAASETMHHWMALLAIKDGDVADAKHHLQDALTFVKEPQHRTGMEKALDLLNKGDVHEGEHEIEEMAGAESPPGITVQRFHLILAMSGVEAKDAAEVKHHLDHFVVKATPEEKHLVEEALEKVAQNDFHEAEHEIEELMKR